MVGVDRSYIKCRESMAILTSTRMGKTASITMAGATTSRTLQASTMAFTGSQHGQEDDLALFSEACWDWGVCCSAALILGGWWLRLPAQLGVSAFYWAVG